MPQLLKYSLVFISAFVVLYLLMLISRLISVFIDRKILGKGSGRSDNVACDGDEKGQGLYGCPEKPDDNSKEC